MRLRMLMAVLAGLLCVLPGAAVARAAGPAPELIVDLRSRGMPAGAVDGKVVAARYGVTAGTPPPRATFTLDATAAAPWLRITPAEPTPGCVQSDAVLTCVLEIASADWTRNVLPLRYTPSPDAEPGTEVTFDYELTADGATPAGYRQGFTLTGPLPDLSATSAHVDGVRAGSRVPVRPRFANVGDAAASGVLVRATLPWAQPARDRRSNCYYSGTQVQCPFPDFRLAPGERAEVSSSTPVTVPVPSWVAGLTSQHVRYAVDPMPAGEPFDPGDARPGTGPPLRLDRLATALADAPDADFLDSEGTFYLHITANPADLRAGAGPVRGRPGETVAMTVRLSNAGPAQVYGTGGQDERWDVATWATLTVDVPAGVDVVSTSCFGYAGDVVGAREPGLTRYRCFPEDGVDPGASVAITLRVRLRAATPSVGVVTVAGGAADPQPWNDTARIEVRPYAAGGAGQGAGGGLPITGPPAAVVALVGAMLAGAGALLVAGAARR
ncbi:hypothetical protein [Pseudosporangium ferrugineum]|uniref:DUF11 domain-containing protein n=1 Tax=Pseudosporangium ferrugineum TaxID=439699 RepID=A0A2T0SB24_9ACTN|nr:hypothetical protein [Pseudosporangium ferrugineum]PRY30616.1 hypothetical protein CLV70_104168 [Pseudosporangium ferrugineum]